MAADAASGRQRESARRITDVKFNTVARKEYRRRRFAQTRIEARYGGRLADRRRKINTSAAAEDLVLVAGKGHEDYQQAGHLRLPFSDVEHVCRDLGIGKGGDA